MENFEFQKDDFGKVDNTNLENRKPNIIARLFIKLGLGKNKDSAMGWALVILIILFILVLIIF